MKTILFAIFFFLSYCASCQIDSNAYNLLRSIIQNQNDLDLIGYLDVYDTSGYDFFSRYTRKRKVWDEVSKSYTLKLSASERKYLNRQIEKARHYRLPDGLIPNAILIPQNSLQEHVLRYPARKVYIISKPMFIRKNSVALLSYTQLNPGTTFPVKTIAAYYQKVNGGWKILALLEEL